MKKITKEQYKDYVTEFVAYTGEQWLGNGMPITFTLDCDDYYYYLTVEVQSSAYDFYDENPEMDNAELERTELFCDEFGCKICETLDEVNELIEEELPEYCKFEVGDDGSICGY